MAEDAAAESEEPPSQSEIGVFRQIISGSEIDSVEFGSGGEAAHCGASPSGDIPVHDFNC